MSARLKQRFESTVAFALTLMFFPWQYAQGQQSYRELCPSLAGEKIFATARADSYLLIGEGKGEDNFRLRTAIDDVLRKRVSFVEVQKVRGDIGQANSFIDITGGPEPSGQFFRMALGPASSPQCVSDDRYPVMLARKSGLLKEGECLQFAVIPAAASRYAVEAFTDREIAGTPERTFQTGVRIFEREGNRVLAHSWVFSWVAPRGERPDRDYSCPQSGSRPRLTDLHRRVLLGGS